MANKVYEESHIQDIANAIREKNGTSNTYLVSEMGDAIRASVNNTGIAKYIVDRTVTEVTAEDLSGITSIGSYAFYACFNLLNVIIPQGATSIQSYAFSNCQSVKSIIIPNSVTSIGNSAFLACYALNNVVIPSGVTKISNSTFYSCSKLSNITIPNSVTSIGDSAFRFCYDLQKINIPSSVTEIGATVFAYCNSLKDVYMYPAIPPRLSNRDSFPSAIKIHVPVGSGNAYKSATNWSSFADKIIEDPEI